MLSKPTQVMKSRVILTSREQPAHVHVQVSEVCGEQTRAAAPFPWRPQRLWMGDGNNSFMFNELN